MSKLQGDVKKLCESVRHSSYGVRATPKCRTTTGVYSNGERLSLHLGIGLRRPPRQGGRPNLGRDSRCPLAAKPAQPRCPPHINHHRPPHSTPGPGDRGLIFGYACDEPPELMPAPIYYAHRLVERQAQLRKDGRLPFLRPDAKSQVTLR